MSDKTSVQVIGLSMGTFLVFLTLKLLGKIDWSWWWVTCPLWAGWVVVCAVLLLSAAAVAVFMFVGWVLSKKGR